MLKRIIQKPKVLFLLFCLIHGAMYSSTIQDRFCTLYLPYRPINFHFANNSKIELENQSSYLLLTMNWQQKINKGYIELFSKIQDELSLSIEQLCQLYGNENIVNEFNDYQEKKLYLIYDDPKTILENDIDDELLSFLKKHLKIYFDLDTIEIILSPNLPCIAEVIYNTESEKYCIILNSTIYNLKNINNKNYYIKKNSENNYVVSINYKDLIRSGFVISASKVHHQLHLLQFILSNYTFYSLHASDKIITLLSRLISFQIYLEIILQADNPLEAAYFYQKLDLSVDNQKHWLALIEDIKKIYTKKSLAKFQKNK